ncbi:hypothetical protein DYU11_25955 [Fibrisoma montanum]|uniref:Uncharacterized protein n=1 Tax=Fibrisoma montanum TaxID=2305895 RepID=A0A418M0E0_9BACT|nr:hypothetical protein [Fibrisoma montanum]RIV18948.1 hypothetical protein DYU11_25955 [Fibrisoma montanum]
MRCQFLLFFLLAVVCPALGQSASTDTSFVRLAVQQAVQVYERTFPDRPHLNNGTEYIRYDYRITGHPYFLTDSTQTGYIQYNGVRYRNVPMRHDIVRGEVLIDQVDSLFRIRLHSERIDSFSLGPHQFVRLVADSLSSSGIRTGFYQVLYDGSVRLLAKRVKTIREDISSGKYKANFEENTRFFAEKKDGTYHEIKTQQSLFGLFPEQEKTLRRYLRTNGIKFRKQRERAITGVVKHYDALAR